MRIRQVRISKKTRVASVNKVIANLEKALAQGRLQDRHLLMTPTKRKSASLELQLALLLPEKIPSPRRHLPPDRPMAAKQPTRCRSSSSPLEQTNTAMFRFLLHWNDVFRTFDLPKTSDEKNTGIKSHGGSMVYMPISPTFALTWNGPKMPPGVGIGESPTCRGETLTSHEIRACTIAQFFPTR